MPTAFEIFDNTSTLLYPEKIPYKRSKRALVAHCTVVNELSRIAKETDQCVRKSIEKMQLLTCKEDGKVFFMMRTKTWKKKMKVSQANAI